MISVQTLEGQTQKEKFNVKMEENDELKIVNFKSIVLFHYKTQVTNYNHA